MKLGKIVIYSLIALFLFSCGASKHSKNDTKLPGTWQSEPISIDGDAKDWPSPYPNYDSKAKIAYATSNDKKYLYISFETGDELTQIKILKSGMTVSIDTGGKKSPQFKINFPLPNDNDILEIPRAEDRARKDDKNNLLNKQFAQKVKRGAIEANQVSIEGFPKCNGGYMVGQSNECGIKVKLGLDEYNELIWEAMIPFKALYNVDSISKNFDGKPISVCFAEKGLKKPDNKGNDNMPANNAGSAMSPGMGGSGGGMRNNNMSKGGGGGRSQIESPLQHLYDNTKTWKQFGISVGEQPK